MRRPRAVSGSSSSSWGGVSDSLSEESMTPRPVPRLDAPEPDAEPACLGEDSHHDYLYLWYWEYRTEYITWRWYRWGHVRNWGVWGRWWEVWRSTNGGPFVKNKGHADGEGHDARPDEWRWCPLEWRWGRDNW